MNLKQIGYILGKAFASKRRTNIIIIAAIGGFLLNIIIGIVVVNLYLQPILDAMSWIEQAAEDVGTAFERAGNWFAGRGWTTNEEAFHNKMKQLGEENDAKIDLPLIAATIYYPYDVGFNRNVAECFSDEGAKENNTQCQEYFNAPATDSNDTTNSGNNTGNKEALKVSRVDSLVNEIKSNEKTTPDYDKYDTYLRDHYIKESKEYQYPWGLGDEEAAEVIEVIIKGIHARAIFYAGMFPTVNKCQIAYGNDAVNQLINDGKITIPIKGTYHVSSCFGPRVLTGSDGTVNSDDHQGIDIVIDSGDTNIYASGDGIIVDSCTESNGEDCGDRGTNVKVAHDFDGNGYGYMTIYQHLASIDAGLLSRAPTTVSGLTGIAVTKGDLIGVQGNTGYVLPTPTAENPTAGTHLHFELKKSSTNDQENLASLNPVSLFSNATSYADNCVVTGGGGNYNIPMGTCATRLVQVAQDIYYNRHPIYRRNNIRYIGPSDEGGYAARENTYNGINTPAGSGIFKTDCNGFVGLVIREAMSLGVPMGQARSLYEITFFGPHSYTGGVWGPRPDKYTKNFYLISTGISPSTMYDLMTVGSIKPGDILGFNGGPDNHHVVVYAGDNMIIENSGGVKYRNLKESQHWSDGSKMTAWRCIDDPNSTVSNAIGGSCPKPQPVTTIADVNCTDPNTKVCVKISETGEIYSMDAYILGVMAQEVGYTEYPMEARKAFVTTIRTYTLGRGRKYHENDRLYVEISGSSAHAQAFRWDKYIENAKDNPKYRENFEKSVTETSNQVMIYNGKIFTSNYGDCTTNYDNHKKQPTGEIIEPYCRSGRDNIFYKEYEEMLKYNPGIGFLWNSPSGGLSQGLSQFGAGYLAAVKSWNSDQILSHYYNEQIVTFDESYLP